MQNYDPLVANGIIYAPIKDIVMSNAPVYGVEQYRYNPSVTVQPSAKSDTFIPSTKKSSSWWKWALGIGATVAGIVGLKKGVKGIRNSVKCQNFFTNHQKVKSFLSSVKNHIPIIKKW